MSKLASMPIFWADFFADTEHMSPDGAKAYLFLLGHAWLRGAKLKNDDDLLARLARVTRRSWAVIRDEVLEFWDLGDDGFLTQKRLSKEFDYVSTRVNANRKNGSLGGMASKGKKSKENNETNQATAQDSLKQPLLTPTPIEEKDSLTTIPKSSRGTRLSPEFVPDETCEQVARDRGFSQSDWKVCIESFFDYWKSASGAKGAKLDWQATCRNWIRNHKLKPKGDDYGRRSDRKGTTELVFEALSGGDVEGDAPLWLSGDRK